MKKAAREQALVECLYRTNYPAFSRMLMRELAGKRYIDLSANECFTTVYNHLDAFGDGAVQQLLVHLPPGHFRTTLAITTALYLSGRYPQRHIAYLAVDRDALVDVIALTERILSLPRMRALFPHLAYSRKSNQFMFQSGGSVSFIVFRSLFDAERMDTIILDEPQRFENARDDKKAKADEQYVRRYLLSTRRRKLLLLLSSRMSFNDISVAFDVSEPYFRIDQCPRYKDNVFQLMWPSVAIDPINYWTPDKIWTRPKHHVLCDELHSLPDQVETARRIGSIAFISRYLQMPLGSLIPDRPEILPNRILRIEDVLEFFFEMNGSMPQFYEVLDAYRQKYGSVEH